MPNWERAGATWRRDGWNRTAKQMVMPASSATSATRRGVRFRLIPSFSRTSEEPEAEDAARLPCLTTFAPVPATTIADIVEMFTVLAPSPPVPTMSTAGPGTSITFACAYMVRTSPVISLDRLALGPQRHHEGGDLRVGRLPAHDQVHRPGGVVGGQVPAVQQTVQQGGPGAARRGIASSGGHSAHQPLLVQIPATSYTTLSSRTARRRAPSVTRTGPFSVAWRRGDQWWPWPLVISLYSSTVGFGIWLSSP